MAGNEQARTVRNDRNIDSCRDYRRTCGDGAVRSNAMIMFGCYSGFAAAWESTILRGWDNKPTIPKRRSQKKMRKIARQKGHAKRRGVRL